MYYLVHKLVGVSLCESVCVVVCIQYVYAWVIMCGCVCVCVCSCVPTVCVLPEQVTAVCVQGAVVELLEDAAEVQGEPAQRKNHHQAKDRFRNLTPLQHPHTRAHTHKHTHTHN